MLNNPETKYQAFISEPLKDRKWPDQQITSAPIWLSTDLRDGNQSIFEPMDVATKIRFFKALIDIGFKEIEVGFPSASDIDYTFVRTIIEQGLIPDDVSIMVITQARKDLIDKTLMAVEGAKNVIVHLYNATAPVWRNIVFNINVEQMLALIDDHVRYIKQQTEQYKDTHWILQYSPEAFSATELDVALKACNTAIEAWDTNQHRPIIINLPSTVENTLPNVFADRIEWMCRNLAKREYIIISVHPHNDRGTGVATAELALLAGAQRIEGCLFGNGERSGNVDIVTLALNLYTQGISPKLDLSNINLIANLVEECTQLPIHPRHPYVGDLVFTAFSGSHQDAIRKGFLHQKDNPIWYVPYLPIDPQDLGRSYESIIRVNSQSGKGGIAYLLERDYQITIPRRLQIEFSHVVQKITDETETEITSQELFKLFQTTYLTPAKNAFYQFHSYRLIDENQEQNIELTFEENGRLTTRKGSGKGPLEATMDALNLPITILSYEESSISSGANAQAIALIEIANQHGMTKFGAGVDQNIVTASIKAIFSAICRLHEVEPLNIVENYLMA